MRRKKRFFIGGVIIFLAIGYLAFTGLKSSATYYFTVTELMGQGVSIYNETVRVDGQVVPGSIEQAAGQVLTFTIADGANSLKVHYQGAVPDTFKAGADIVAEGKLDANGVFEADTLMAKCASKYEPQL
ncbi:MAG: cytochrome c maturation protein CcmE [Chloroflexota bacterium]